MNIYMAYKLLETDGYKINTKYTKNYIDSLLIIR